MASVRSAGPVQLVPRSLPSRAPAPTPAPVSQEVRRLSAAPVVFTGPGLVPPVIDGVPVASLPALQAADDEGQTMAVILVTPELAAAWLAADILRRPVIPERVDMFSRDMKADHWALNGETIKIRIDNGVLDGTTRLSACVKADVPFKSWVAQNLPQSAQATVDIGRPRSMSDQFALVGEKNAVVLASVAKRAWQWLHGYRGTRMPSPTQTEITELLASAPVIREAAGYAVGAHKRFPNVRVVVLATAYLAFCEVNDVAAIAFLEQVVNGEGLKRGDPAWAFRDRMIRGEYRGKTLHEAGQLALLIQAWKAWREERTLDRVQLPPGGLKASNFPKVQ